MKHVGYNAHRLKEDDRYYAQERIFVQVINDEIKRQPNFLDMLVNKKIDDKKEYLTKDEEKVALSVIQWLGTPVGQGFLKEVNKELEANGIDTRYW